MAGKKDNIKSLFSNTRSRIIILFTFMILLIAVVVGFFKFYKTSVANQLSSSVTGAPGIQSIPGALDPTVQYVALQNTQNSEQAASAMKSGNSAIPTIVQSQKLGDGINSVGAQGGTGGLGFTALAREDQEGLQRSGWVQELQNNNCSKTSINSVLTQGGALTDLKNGCSCVQLKYGGLQLTQLDQVCSCGELRSAGYNARQLKEAGYSAGRLHACGFDACELRNAGFTAQEMKDGGFSDDELKGAGFNEAEITRAGGLPNGITAEDVRKAGCDATKLAQLKASGVSAAAIRRISGCSINQLKAAGFGAEDLKNAGFTAANLKNAGFTPAELRQAGFISRDLLNAGYTTGDLQAAGYSPEDIASAENELPPGITPDDIKKAGCDVNTLTNERLAGVSAKLIKQYAGCSAQALKAAGFTDQDLANAGFTQDQIRAAGNPSGVSASAGSTSNCDPAKLQALKNAGVSALKIHDDYGCSVSQLKAAGFDAESLINAGFTPQDLAAAGFTPDQIRSGQTASEAAIKAAGCDPAKLRALMNAGVNAQKIRNSNGCSASQLKAAGYDAKSLLNAGFTPADLAAAGFSAQQIAAGEAASDQSIKNAGCDPDKLRALMNAGVSASKIRNENGCSAAQLKAAGFDAASLAAAGFSPADLAAAGFASQGLSQGSSGAAGASGPASFIVNGRKTDCSLTSLQAARAAGLSAAAIRQTIGCSAASMKVAGFTAADLKNAGFTAAELRDAAFSPADLKAAGFSVKELHAAGFSAQDLKNAGFSATQLKDVGFNAADLKAAGFSANDLKAAGYNTQNLKDAGFSASDLKNAGYSAEDLKKAGFGASELHAAGYTADALQNAGFNDNQIRNAGYSKAELANAGIEASQVQGLDQTGQTVGTSTLPGVPGYQAGGQASAAQANAKQLQAILDKQNTQLADQKFQQKIQQQQSNMMTAANQAMQGWKNVPAQVFVAGSSDDSKVGAAAAAASAAPPGVNPQAPGQTDAAGAAAGPGAIIKTGDVLFAVIDTSVNSDEPSPILATIVSGRLKGSKLIGSFNLPSNADKMIISFNTLSVPGASRTVSISAYAIDANTARTAVSSKTNHHYLLRYGSLFASSFLEGFGNAFQSANTTITIGGSGSGNNTTTIEGGGAGQSALENAVIGLATVGKAWGQVAQQQFSTPTTVEVYSGTGIGVLFTQDLTTL